MIPKKVVLVLSGKGGTGKTFVSVNIGFELSSRGKKVAILDADCDSPNLTELIEVPGEQTFSDIDRLKPLKSPSGIEVFSMATIAKNRPISMSSMDYSEIIEEVVEFGDWTAEYMVVDLPAGSGDEWKRSISVFGDKLIGSVIVSQPAHALDAERMIQLHKKYGIPVVGLIENMSYFQPAKKKYYVFGKPVGERLAKRYGIDFLGDIPLSMEVRGAVEEKRRLEGELSLPIKRAVDKILKMKPQQPKFLKALREKVVEVTTTGLVRFLKFFILFINKDVNIADLQKESGAPGGRVTKINLVDEGGRTLLPINISLRDGKLKLIRNPDKIDLEINLFYKAFAWAILGEKPLDGETVKYDLMDAWLLHDGEIVRGRGDIIRTMRFFVTGLAKKAQEQASPRLKMLARKIA